MYKGEEAKCKSEDQRQLLFKKSTLFLYLMDIYANYHGTKLTMQVAVHTTTTTQLYLCLINNIGAIALLFCPTRLMVVPFMITIITAARLFSLVSRSK